MGTIIAQSVIVLVSVMIGYALGVGTARNSEDI